MFQIKRIPNCLLIFSLLVKYKYTRLCLWLFLAYAEPTRRQHKNLQIQCLCPLIFSNKFCLATSFRRLLTATTDKQ